MWLFTNFGMFSVVEHRGDHELVFVRARVKGDLELLQQKYLPNLGKITESPSADYPYRALAWRTEFAEAMKKAVLEIDYDNFKSSVSKTQGYERHDVYMKVWAIMRSAESLMKDMKRAWVKKASQKSLFDDDLNDPKNYKFSDDDNGEHKFLGIDGPVRSTVAELDRDAARRARNERLGVGNRDAEKERERVKNIEKLVASQLKDKENDCEITQSRPVGFSDDEYIYQGTGVWCRKCGCYGGHMSACSDLPKKN